MIQLGRFFCAYWHLHLSWRKTINIAPQSDPIPPLPACNTLLKAELVLQPITSMV
jgi:hypothetical protein